MAKQQTIQNNFVLNGRVDNSFTQVGEALLNLGSQIDQISQKIITFGKESVKTYAEYDDIMRETQAVGGYTSAEMQKLDELNRQIAQTSTYSNIQSANAMVLIAQAGKTVQEQYELLPSVLDLAMAGNLDLANSVDYLLSSLSSMGKGMDYASTLTDQMAKTASIGMTDIDTLGESLMRLGSASGEFFSSSEEILAILSAMSQFGHDQRGAQAGTWLRNFMLSLAAPTGDIEDMIDAMEQLGVAQDEIEDYASSKSSGQAALAVQSLMEQGLRIYDDSGKLLPAIEIIKSLRDAVRGNAEYAGDLLELTGALNSAGGDIDSFLTNTSGLTNNALYNTFSKIFGKRGITTALNLISISDQEWEETLSGIINSEGFADSMSETMQGGIGGAIRELEAAFTELKTTIGEELSPMIESGADWLKEIVTGISNLDDKTLSALVSGTSVIAAAGPGLLLAGGAFRLIGTLISPGGLFALGVTALATAATAADKLREIDMASSFGTMNMDSAALSEYVAGLGESFKAAYTEVNAFNAALDDSVESYTTASSAFASDLLTAMLTQTTLTDSDKAKLQGLGDDMYAAVVSGITNSTSASMAYFNMLFGGDGTAEYDPNYQEIINLTNQSYLDALATAESIGTQLRDAMTEAFADGTISEEEYARILGFVQEYNDAMAKAATEAQAEEDYVKQQMLYHKAETASYDDIQAFANDVEAERSSVLAQEEETYLKERFKLQYRGADDEALKELDKRHEERVNQQSAVYDGVLMRLWQSGIQQSELGTAYADLENLAGLVLGGEIQSDTAVEDFREAYGNGNTLAGEGQWNPFKKSTRQQLGEYLARMIASFGGYDGLLDKIDYYEQNNMQEDAEYLRKLYAMQQINDAYAKTQVYNYSGIPELFGKKSVVASSSSGEYSTQSENKDAFEKYVSGYAYSLDTARNAAAYLGYDELIKNALFGNDEDVQKEILNEMLDSDSELGRMIANLNEIYDLDRIISDIQAEYAHDATAGDSDRSLTNFSQDSTYGELAALYSLLYGNAGRNPDAYKRSFAIDVTDNGSALDTRYEIESAFSSPITQDIDVRFSGRTSGGSGRPNTSLSAYAEGGRADEPSIFGEAGAEWAIPEEHSARTASLLDAARAASGFTWPELLSRSGGLGGGGSASTLVYSPTIVAQDARDVEQKLLEDKARLDRWYREQRLRNEVEVYA